MFQAKRPRAPKEFICRSRDFRKRIRQRIASGQALESDHFDDLWSGFKQVLAEAQHGRCGYCDCKVLATGDGTIDHYRPKSKVEALGDDEASWGRETPHSASIRDRKTVAVSTSGYHWLAYTWSNYVFACSNCNSKFKRCIFPVASHPRCCSPRPRTHEEPLLLSCYCPRRPSDHLQFNRDGTVEVRNGSEHGRETIRTVGLDRTELRDLREEVTLRVYDILGEYGSGEDAAIDELLKLGAEKHSFAGVTRAIVEQQMEMTWEDFVGTFSSI